MISVICHFFQISAEINSQLVVIKFSCYWAAYSSAGFRQPKFSWKYLADEKSAYSLNFHCLFEFSLTVFAISLQKKKQKGQDGIFLETLNHLYDIGHFLVDKSTHWLLALGTPPQVEILKDLLTSQSSKQEAKNSVPVWHCWVIAN